jgi:hypothetical protein
MRTAFTHRRRPGHAAVGIAGFCLLVATAPRTAAGAPPDPAKAAPAKQAVVSFLDAIKRGDDDAARGLLTKVARDKTAEIGMEVAPPVADTATYTVQDCELIGGGDDIAHVATVWTDVDETGARTSENVIWVVRLDPEGWRVVGMAVRIFEDMPPLLLNFEDPEDMLAKQEAVSAELTRRAQQAAAGQPGPRTAQGVAPQPARQ